MRKIAILGAGGFAKEVIVWAERAGCTVLSLYDGTVEKDTKLKVGGKEYKVSNKIDFTLKYVMGVGYPNVKKKIIKNFENKIQLADPIIDPSAIIGPDVYIGSGSVIAPNAVLSTNIKLGRCASINPGVTIGHDCVIGDYFNASPVANISGNVTIGNGVFFGTNACIREKLSVNDDIIIGMGSVITKNILETGTYIGSPARKM